MKTTNRGYAVIFELCPPENVLNFAETLFENGWRQKNYDPYNDLEQFVLSILIFCIYNLFNMKEKV